jgi:D-alanyl-D-alanine carboxypeptidase
MALPDGRAISMTSGYADTGRRIPLRVNDRLLAGSTGKTFFAALALQLVAEGRLDLDARISTWLGSEPWFARLPNGSDIVVRHLMNHTSGLVRYEFDSVFVHDLLANPMRDWQVREQLEYILGDAPPFAAGEGWEYSDTNYLVLGLIIERILGGAAYDAIATRFLRPFGLSGTVPSVSPTIERLAVGYGAAADPLGLAGAVVEGDALRVNPKFEWAGGGFASTPEDLSRWAQILYDGRAIPPAQLEQALTTVAARGLGTGVRYGLGVIVRETPLGIVYGHSGFFPGYLTEMRYYAASRIGVAVQVNTSDQRAFGRSPAALAHALAERAGRAVAARVDSRTPDGEPVARREDRR